MSNLLRELEKSQLRSDLPAFKAGETERVQYLEGIVIGFPRNGPSTTFKVRKESYGVGVERTFPLHSPLLERIEVKKRGDVRRAKLFFLRKVSGKKARIREKKDWLGEKGVAGPGGETAEKPQEGGAAPGGAGRARARLPAR